MMNVLSGFKNKVRPLLKPGLQAVHPYAGLHSFVKEENGGKSRIHLRIDPDGSGLLIVNANRVFQLNPSAAFMAFLALNEIPNQKAVDQIRDAFRVTAHQASSDYQLFSVQLNELVAPDGKCPVCEMDLEVTVPFSARPSAPYRMDLALTYRCNNNCAHCYNARPRNFPELSTLDWKRIIDKLWQIGIPHIVFTGGEPTLRDDLPELIAHAEENGQITGINTNGRKLSDASYLRELVKAGLDHVQITYESHDEKIHDKMVDLRGAWRQTSAALKNVLAEKLFVMTNTTLLRDNAALLPETLQTLANLGVPTIGLNALIHSGRGELVDTGLPEAELGPLLEIARQITDRHNQRLIWYTPTQYCHFDPMQLELGVKGCTAALFNMCVEPDGAVIPCQSFYRPLGNILIDPWNTIWDHELSVSLRERKSLPLACRSCSMVTECGGGCPLSLQKPQPLTCFSTFA